MIQLVFSLLPFSRVDYNHSNNHLLVKKNTILVRHMNHKNPIKRIMERTAVAYKRNRKYPGVRVVAAS